MIDFGKRLTEIREKMKLTQSQFAELVQLSEDSIGKLERGVSQPKLNTLEKMAEGLKMSIAELIGEKKIPKPQNPALDDLTSYLKTKSPQDIDLIQKVAVLIFEQRKKN